MSNSLSTFGEHFVRLSDQLLDYLSGAKYTQPEGTSVDVKRILESLISNKIVDKNITDTQLCFKIRDTILACALILSSEVSTSELLSWVPSDVVVAAKMVFKEISEAYCGSDFGERNKKKNVNLLDLGFGLLDDEKRLLVEFLPEMVVLLKDRIKETSIDKNNVDGDDVSAASARIPVGYAILAAFQFRWLIEQFDHPQLGKLCNLVIPCGLTALDHWSPEVKGQGMICFIHLAKNVKVSDIGCYGDVILDACCQNIASADEIWHLAVEMSVLLVTCIQQSNPRSQWFDKILTEMLGHLERQPRNKDRRIAWLLHVDPLLQGLGLVLLSHFRRLFHLLFEWMHADQQTLLLVLKRVYTIIRITWIRNSHFVERLVDELAALRTSNEEIKEQIYKIMVLLKQCKGKQFEKAWEKHHNDPNVSTLAALLERPPLTIC